MSQHPSLKVDSVGAKHRNVLKRYERIKKLQEQNKWERDSAFGLPKVKSVKIKVKKVKEAAAEETAGTGAAPAAAGAAAPPAAAAKTSQPQAAAKTAAPPAAKGEKGKQ